MRKFDPKKHRLPILATDAILLVDKPATWTSFDVVNFVRARFNIPKVGHCGTLDPAATGLLVLVLGKFTRISGALSGVDKIYEATLKLGIETDTEDMDGNIIRIEFDGHKRIERDGINELAYERKAEAAAFTVHKNDALEQ